METDELAPGRTRNPHAESAPTSGRYGPGGLKPLDSPDATTVGERVGIVQTGIEAGNSGGNGTGAQTGCRKLGRGQRQNRVPLINVPSGSGAGIGGPKHNGPAKDVIARVERGGNDVESKKHAVGERHGGRKDSRWEGGFGELGCGLLANYRLGRGGFPIIRVACSWYSLKPPRSPFELYSTVVPLSRVLRHTAEWQVQAYLSV
ncbi:hypothetical protein FRC08_007078 [Ceratobasidium sp. 394]|nr:hypothetical protein FRC08_007078 [Ceratobasidium sp. 394]